MQVVYMFYLKSKSGGKRLLWRKNSAVFMLRPICLAIADFEIKIDLEERLQPTFLNQIRLQCLILAYTCVQTWCNLID